MKRSLLAMFGIAVLLSWSAAQETSRPFKVTIKDGKTVVGEATMPIDPQQRIQTQYSGANAFGLTVDGRRITCSTNGSVWGTLRVDGNNNDPFNDPNFGGRFLPKSLPATASGKKRLGSESTWAYQNIQVTQIIETVPSKPSTKGAAVEQKRRLDTCRITYILENKDKVPHKVAFKTSIDILIVNNDGALYAAPTTQPGKVLNGVALEGKTLPEYIWVIENPNFANPGFVATMTLKHSKGENPYKISLSNLGIVGNFQVWDPLPQAAGDSACALFWAEKEMKPGEKRELVWGYGGGISTSPENEGRVSLGLNGNFDPGKLFTITAHVDDPLPEQALALELPAGIERVEGREIQPVATGPDLGTGVVLWKARVVRPGDYEIVVRSSTGTVQSKHLKVEAVSAR